MAWNLPDGCTLDHIDDALGYGDKCGNCGQRPSRCRCWATEPEDAPGYEDGLNHD